MSIPTGLLTSRPGTAAPAAGKPGTGNSGTAPGGAGFGSAMEQAVVEQAAGGQAVLEQAAPGRATKEPVVPGSGPNTRPAGRGESASQTAGDQAAVGGEAAAGDKAAAGAAVGATAPAAVVFGGPWASLSAALSAIVPAAASGAAPAEPENADDSDSAADAAPEGLMGAKPAEDQAAASMSAQNGLPLQTPPVAASTIDAVNAAEGAAGEHLDGEFAETVAASSPDSASHPEVSDGFGSGAAPTHAAAAENPASGTPAPAPGTPQPSPVPANQLPAIPLPASAPLPATGTTTVPAGFQPVLPTALAAAAAAISPLPAGQSEDTGADPAVPAPVPATGSPQLAAPVQAPASPLGPLGTAAPATVQAALPAHHAATPLLTQVAQPLFSLAAAAPGEHIMTLSITPENLGPVTVRAHVSAEGLRVELFAPNEAGRDALRTIMTELRRDLSGSGLNTTLTLSSQQQPGAETGQGNQERRDAAGPTRYRGADPDADPGPSRPQQTFRPVAHGAASTIDILA